MQLTPPRLLVDSLNRLGRYFIRPLKVKQNRGFIFNFHEIISAFNKPQFVSNASNCTPESFSIFLDFINGLFTVVSLPELLNHFENTDSILLKPLAAVTFDDGHRSILDNAIPLLASKNIKPTIFLSTSSIDNATPFFPHFYNYLLNSSKKGKVLEVLFSNGFSTNNFKVLKKELNYLSISQRQSLLNIVHKHVFPCEEFFNLPNSAFLSVQDLCHLKLLADFGIHSHSHHVLSRLNTHDLCQDISSSINVFTNIFNFKPDLIAIPYGGFGTSYTRYTSRVIRSFNLKYIFSCFGGSVKAPICPYCIHRIGISEISLQRIALNAISLQKLSKPRFFDTVYELFSFFTNNIYGKEIS